MIPEILVFSKKVWEALSAEDQALITKLAKEAQLEQRALWMAKEEESIADMKAHNVTITEITPEEKKRFQDAMKPVWDKYGSQYAELLGKIQAVQ
jgi:TRAP-type C4-dicarboxylate transport system substrate-binding protein